METTDNQIKKQKYRLGLYEKAMPNSLNIEEKLAYVKICGFDWLELSIDESDEKQARLCQSAAEISLLRDAAFSSGVPIHTMCLSGHRKYPLGSHDPAISRKSLDIMKRAIDLSCNLGIRLIQLAGYDVYYEPSDESTRERFGENLAKCTELAAKSGIALGFETMETPFMDTVSKAMKWVSRIESPYLGLYPDIGNLSNASLIYGHDIIEDLHLGNGHIFAAHLKETSAGVYRDLFFGNGTTPYASCIHELVQQGVRMFTGEFWYDPTKPLKETLLSASSFLRSLIDQEFSASPLISDPLS